MQAVLVSAVKWNDYSTTEGGMTVKVEGVRTGTFLQFKDNTLAVARGGRKVAPNDPKIWIERGDAQVGADRDPIYLPGGRSKAPVRQKTANSST